MGYRDDQVPIVWLELARRHKCGQPRESYREIGGRNPKCEDPRTQGERRIAAFRESRETFPRGLVGYPLGGHWIIYHGQREVIRLEKTTVSHWNVYDQYGCVGWIKRLKPFFEMGGVRRKHK